MPRTPRFDLHTFEPGETDWSHTDTVEALDELAIERGPIADRPASGSYDDELYLATDQRICWRWDADAGDWLATSGLGTEGRPVPGTTHLEALDVDTRFGDTHFVDSASSMNAALEELADTGGTVRWKSGYYEGDSFTERVVIPSNAPPITLDMRNVEIKITQHDPFHGAADGDDVYGDTGAFFYKPPAGDPDADKDESSGGSSVVNVFGPDRFAASSAATRAIRPHGFVLWDTERCHVRPRISGPSLDRCLYFRQSANSGHHVTTEHTKVHGGNVCIQVGNADDPYGKDRCHWYGQLGGYREAGIYIEKGLNNRDWCQVERPSNDPHEHVSGHRIRSGQNSIMLCHRSDVGHATDVAAPNCGIFDSGAIGSNGTFENERLGVRPSNINVPNYEWTAYDFATDWRPVLETVEPGEATVDYDAAAGELTLQGESSSTTAAVQTAGPAGLMSHFFHAYANVHVGESLASKQLRFGAWVDPDNYAFLTYDATGSAGSISRPIGVEIAVDGEAIVDRYLEERVSRRPSGWIVYLNREYQVFFHRYDVVYEDTVDLSGWPNDPHLRIEAGNPGGSGEPVGIRRIEHGLAQKREQAGF